MAHATSDTDDDETYALIGAAMRVHGVLGRGFLEAVYQEALAIEFGIRSIPHAREAALPIDYAGHRLRTTYRADFVCYERIVVETKALARLGASEEAQLLNYLKAGEMRRGLLLNFGAARLEVRRFVLAS